MIRQDLQVPARYYVHLAEMLASNGVDIAQVIEAAGLRPPKASEADALMKFAEVERLIAQLRRVTGRTDLGFEVGQRLTVGTHSFVGFGMLSSVDVDRALAFLARYFRLVMPSFRLRYRYSPDSGELHFTPTIAMGHECLAFHLEAIAMAALRDVRDMSGRNAVPCRIHFSVAEPAHAARYAELRGVTADFGAERVPGVRLLFDSDLRAYPLTMADDNALRVAEQRCKALVTHVAKVRQFKEWVTMTLREVGEGLPTLAELAAMLNISSRTLNRHLEREGTTFRALSGCVQHDLACERLAGGTMSVTEVAYSLGFADPANFTRAFRERAHCSPREYRRRMTDETSGA